MHDSWKWQRSVSVYVRRHSCAAFFYSVETQSRIDRACPSDAVLNAPHTTEDSCDTTGHDGPVSHDDPDEI